MYFLFADKRGHFFYFLCLLSFFNAPLQFMQAYDNNFVLTLLAPAYLSVSEKTYETVAGVQKVESGGRPIFKVVLEC